jgi:hypothetical protein
VKREERRKKNFTSFVFSLFLSSFSLGFPRARKWESTFLFLLGTPGDGLFWAS